MKNYMRKSAAFSHVFFTFAFAFLLFLCFFRYLRLPIFLSALFAFTAACCAAALIAAFLGENGQKLLFSLRAEKEKNALALYLSLASPNEILLLFRAGHSPICFLLAFCAMRLRRCDFVRRECVRRDFVRFHFVRRSSVFLTRAVTR